MALVECPECSHPISEKAKMCPNCGQRIDLFKRGGGKALADEMKVPFLGSIPIDPDIVTSGDAGDPFIKKHTRSLGAEAFTDIVGSLLEQQATAPPSAEHQA